MEFAQGKAARHFQLKFMEFCGMQVVPHRMQSSTPRMTFSRIGDSQPKPSFVTVTGPGGQPNLYPEGPLNFVEFFKCNSLKVLNL